MCWFGQLAFGGIDGMCSSCRPCAGARPAALRFGKRAGFAEGAQAIDIGRLRDAMAEEVGGAAVFDEIATPLRGSQ